jgi:beta-glucanase (GH16 family)
LATSLDYPKVGGMIKPFLSMLRQWAGCAVLACAFLTPVQAAEPASTNGWKLVWSDEFDKPGLPDPSKWGYEEGFVRNNEKQYYTRERMENARVENGKLILEARKEEFKNGHYTSASLTTRGKASWTTGRIEVRAKLPRGNGMWPAIWMLGNDVKHAGWPACGEIDIMEYVGFDPDTIHANVHTKKYNHMRGNGRGSTLKVPAPFDGFHNYILEWHADRLDFFVDDQKNFTCKDEGTGEDAWPFNMPEYLILNIAVGGAWGGQKGIDDTIFPQRMEIDYVRAYQK